MKEKRYIWSMVRMFIFGYVLFYAIYRYYDHSSVERSITGALIIAVAVLLVDILFYRFYLKPRLLRQEQERQEQEQKQQEQEHLAKE